MAKFTYKGDLKWVGKAGMIARAFLAGEYSIKPPSIQREFVCIVLESGETFAVWGDAKHVRVYQTPDETTD